MRKQRDARPTIRSNRGPSVLADMRRLSRDAISDDVRHLRTLVAILGGSEISSMALELLPDVLARAELLGISRAALADACEVSEATISRWTARITTPHAVMARFALEKVREVALALQREKIAEADALAGPR
jgi:hypothetical protein